MNAHHITALRDHMENCRAASLGSLKADGGHPYVSLVNFALSGEGFPILLLSNLAWHTQNLERDGRGSLLITDVTTIGDALMGQRMTLIGDFEKSADAGNRATYLQKHPEAVTYIDFADFKFWRMIPKQVHVVAGFGRIKTYDAADVFLLPP